MGFRANVWNIGAEGQLTMGAIAGGGVALWFGDSNSIFAMPLMLLAGVLGGMAWAAIPAFLRTRFNTNEILVTLMLVYIAQLLLSWLVHGPWRDPEGQNYPQSQGFGDAADHVGSDRRHARDLGHRLRRWDWRWSPGWSRRRPIAGFRMQVAGLAPAAAAYAGFSEKRNIWIALLVCGATAGLAGICEVAGPIGRLQQTDFAGLWLCRDYRRLDRPAASDRRVFGALLMSLLYLGGEVGADGNELAVRDHRIVPGIVAVLPAGGRSVHHFPAQTCPSR